MDEGGGGNKSDIFADIINGSPLSCILASSVLVVPRNTIRKDKLPIELWVLKKTLKRSVGYPTAREVPFRTTNYVAAQLKAGGANARLLIQSNLCLFASFGILRRGAEDERMRAKTNRGPFSQ